MADRWLRVPATAGEFGGQTAKYGNQLDGWSGQVLAESPRYLIRAYADEATLDSIESEPQVSAMSDGQVENALNALFDAGRDIDGWKRGFSVE